MKTANDLKNSGPNGSCRGGDRRRPAVWLPLIFLASASALILLFDLDLRFQHLFFNEETGWFLQNSWWVFDLYDYGTWPAVGLALGALLACLTALAWRRLRHWLRPSLFLVLVMLLGPGLVVNGIFKANFGRPRPKRIEEFGQHKTFLPLFRKGVRKTGASFPSGHASMGFYLMAPYFILLGRRRRLARLALAIGITAGSTIGLARLCAGDHFLGDILWSWGFVYLSGLACYYLMRLNRQPVARGGP